VWMFSLFSMSCYDFSFGHDCTQPEVKIMILMLLVWWSLFSVDAVSG
jgi:hypothetical protein